MDLSHPFDAVKEQKDTFNRIDTFIDIICDFIFLSSLLIFLQFADGLRDCEDPECCGSRDCESNQLCYTVPKPINILLQRQPPAPTASFFEKMRFIIEEGSLQRYSKNSAFNER